MKCIFTLVFSSIFILTSITQAFSINQNYSYKPYIKGYQISSYEQTGCFNYTDFSSNLLSATKGNIIFHKKAPNITPDFSRDEVFPTINIKTIEKEQAHFSLYKTLDELNKYNHDVVSYKPGTKYFYNQLIFQEKYNKYSTYFYIPNSDNICLTFDLKKESGYTIHILNTLKEHNIKATFFVTTEYAKSRPELVMRMINEGHDVGGLCEFYEENSSYCPDVLDIASSALTLDNYIKEVFDYNVKFFKHYNGLFSEQSLVTLEDLGYLNIFSSYDIDSFNTQSINNIESNFKHGIILSFDATSYSDTIKLNDFLNNIKSNNYNISKIDKTSLNNLVK